MSTLRPTRLKTLTFMAVAIAAWSTSAAQAGTVKIGVSVPLTGVQAGVGREAQMVWEAFAKHANSKQLAGAHTLEVVTLDDGFDPVKAKANAEQLAQQGADVVVSTAGIPTVKAMVPVLAAAKVPLLAPGSGSLLLHGAGNEPIFHVKASFGAEMDQMAKQLSAMRLRKIVVITDDAVDRSDLVQQFGAEISKISKGESKLAATVVVAQQGGKPQEAVAQAMADKPDAIYVMTIPGLAGGVLKELRAKGFSGYLTAWSVANVENVITALGASGAGIIFGTVVPSPTSSLVGVRENFQQFAQDTGIKPTFRAMEIYIAGRVLLAAVAKAGAAEPSGAAVWKGLESLGALDLGGWRITYSPKNRDGSKLVDTMMLSASGKFR
jgi:branched-chain amino acid transport system substrate-binding protein